MLLPSRDNREINENHFKSSGWKKNLFSQQEKKKRTWLVNNEIFDLNWFDLYETLVLELINLVAALCVVTSSGICPSGCQRVTPLPKLGISDTPLWVRFSNISTYYSPK